MKNVVPVLTVLLTIVAIWYAAAFRMNRAWTYDQAARAGTDADASRRSSPTR